MKIDVLYWQITDHADICTVTTGDDGHQGNHSMGVFIYYDKDNIHLYMAFHPMSILD